MPAAPEAIHTHNHTHEKPEAPINRFTKTEKTLVLVALIAAWLAMLGSLYLSEILHFVPCTLCWYQRILMYPLSIILLVGYLRKDKGVFLYTLVFSILGIGVSTYHYLLQKTTIFSHSAVCETGIPCTTVWINLFGFITIPFLALIGFFIIIFAGLLFLSQQAVFEES